MAAAVDVNEPWHLVKKTLTRSPDDYMAVEHVRGFERDITRPSPIDWGGAHGLAGLVYAGQGYLSSSAETQYGLFKIILGAAAGIEAVTVCPMPKDGSFSDPIPLREEGMETLFIAHGPGFLEFLAKQSLHAWLMKSIVVSPTPTLIMQALKSETIRFADIACHRKRNDTPDISLFFFSHRSQHSFVISDTEQSRSDALKTMRTHCGEGAFTEVYQNVVMTPPRLTPSEEDEIVAGVRRGGVGLRAPNPVFTANPFSVAAASASTADAGCASDGTPTPSPPAESKEADGDAASVIAMSLTVAGLSLRRPRSRQDLSVISESEELSDASPSYSS